MAKLQTRLSHNGYSFKRSRRGTSMAELPPSMFIFFFALFPLIDMIGLCTGAVTSYLITTQCAVAAAGSINFDAALAASITNSNNLKDSGLGKFAKLAPVGGASGSGVDLYITGTKTADNSLVVYGPNTHATPPVVLDGSIVYEYEAIGTYDVGPFLSLAGCPWLGDVPGLGKPMRLRFSATRNVEHPEGIIGEGAIAYMGSGSNPGQTDHSAGTLSTPAGTTPNPNPGMAVNPFIYTTLVPVDPNNPAAGFFLMTYNVAVDPNSCVGNTLTVSGVFLTQSQAAQIQVGNNFQVGNDVGSALGQGTNPLSNIDPTVLGINRTDSDYTKFTNDPQDITYTQQDINNSNLSASQKAAVMEGYANMVQWAAANGY